MKHLKLYEMYDTPTRTHTAEEFDKYIAWLSSNDTGKDINIYENKYNIELFKGDPKFPILKIDHLYTFNFNDDSLKKMNYKKNDEKISGFLLHDEALQKRLLYQSNDLQEVIDMLPELKKYINYNL